MKFNKEEYKIDCLISILKRYTGKIKRVRMRGTTVLFESRSGDGWVSKKLNRDEALALADELL
jgi:hypothetical protein